MQQNEHAWNIRAVGRPVFGVQFRVYYLSTKFAASAKVSGDLLLFTYGHKFS